MSGNHAETVIGDRRGSSVVLYLAKTIILFTLRFDALAVHAANLLTEAQGVLAHGSKLVTVEVTQPLERGNAVILALRVCLAFQTNLHKAAVGSTVTENKALIQELAERADDDCS